MPGQSLTHADISKALLDSTDDGKTLDFSHKNLSDVGESGAEELAAIGVDGLNDECIVSRVALGYNRLATLPMAFALLTRLRYLNLRANCFAVFPDVLTVMPSLEVLDMSRNKLKRLPSQPGTLLGLRVLSLSKNRLTRLPSYISKASKLTLLQLDHNPLDWPPKSIWESLQHADDPESMASQIDSIRKWLSDHSNSIDVQKGQNIPDMNEEGVYGTQGTETDLANEDAHFDLEDSNHKIPQLKHSRSFSAESDISLYSTTSHESNTSDLSFYATSDNETLSKDTVSTMLASSHIPNGSMLQDMDEDPTGGAPENSQQRSRGLSKGKKSSSDHLSKLSLPLLPRERQGMLRSRAYTSDGSIQSSESEVPSPSLINKKHEMFSPENEDFQTNHSHTNPFVANASARAFISPSSHAMAPPMDVERNSYFRRISTLPPLPMQRSLPEPLQAMVESARGILFAVSQIYQSLRHYIVFAIDDRLSGLLGKVLEPASQYMSHLINALDRFDSSSRRSIPPAHICRNVLESCKDNVAVFGKVIGVLHFQLKVLAGADDARYSRSLLLMLYGSMVEVSHSWQTIVPYLDSLIPHLKDVRNPPPVSKNNTQTTPLTPLSNSGRPLQPTSSSTPQTPGSASSISNGRFRLNRRHAGSFSFKDVEMGKAMLSDSPVDTFILATAPLRFASKRPSSPQVTRSSSIGSSSDTPPQHGATFSPAVVNTNSSTSSHTPPSPSRQGSSGTKFGNSLDPPTDSFRIVDENLLDTMDTAVETACSVWKMLDDILRFGDDSGPEFSEALQAAQAITKKLSEHVRKFRDKSSDSNRKAFWEDAHAFVKTVVNVLTLIKARSSYYPSSLNLRNNIARLTQSTQDFAILLQVSSFSPAPTPVLYSPAQMIVTPVKPKGFTIVRSRSAQVNSQSSQPAKSDEREPWSALPNHSFKLPMDS